MECFTERGALGEHFLSHLRIAKFIVGEHLCVENRNENNVGDYLSIQTPTLLKRVHNYAVRAHVLFII